MKKLFIMLCFFAAFQVNAASQCTEQMVKNYWQDLRKASDVFGQQLIADKGLVYSSARLSAFKYWEKTANESAEKLSKTLSISDINISSQRYAARVLNEFGENTELYPKVELSSNMRGFSNGISFISGKSSVISGEYSEKTILIPSDIDYTPIIADLLGCIPTERFDLKDRFIDIWAKAWSAYKDPFADWEANELAKHFIASEEAWDSYLYQSRYQYPWEKYVTAWYLKDELSGDQFKAPPSYQLHFLRPWAVLEYVKEAPDGNQFKEALSVEWLGINFWDGCFNTKVACGASLTSTFSDRAGVDDIGHGVMFHVANQYSFGVISRDSDLGIFLTVDLLKALTDKRSEVASWQKIAKDHYQKISH